MNTQNKSAVVAKKIFNQQTVNSTQNDIKQLKTLLLLLVTGILSLLLL